MSKNGSRRRKPTPVVGMTCESGYVKEWKTIEGGSRIEVCRPMTADEVLQQQQQLQQMHEQQQLARQEYDKMVKHSNKVGMWVGVGFAAFFVLMCLCALVDKCKRRWRRSSTTVTPPM